MAKTLKMCFICNGKRTIQTQSKVALHFQNEKNPHKTKNKTSSWNSVDDPETESTRKKLTTQFRLHFIFFSLHSPLFCHLFPNSLSLNPPKVTGSFNEHRNRNGDSSAWITARKSKAVPYVKCIGTCHFRTEVKTSPVSAISL